MSDTRYGVMIPSDTVVFDNAGAAYCAGVTNLSIDDIFVAFAALRPTELDAVVAMHPIVFASYLGQCFAARMNAANLLGIFDIRVDPTLTTIGNNSVFETRVRTGSKLAIIFTREH